MDHSTSPNPQRPSPEADKPSDSPLGQMAQAMEQSLGGVQASVGTMMSTLAQSMKRTMDMTQSMNSLMETYIQRSVRLTATVSTADHLLAPLVTVAITNRSQVPLPGAVLCLHLTAHTPALERTSLSPATLTPDDKTASDSTTIASQYRLAAEATDSIFHGQLFDAAGQISSQPFRLSANSNREECIALIVPSFRQYQATLTLHFNNPATQRPLQAIHSFGVYLLFQCHRHVPNPLSQIPTAKMPSLDTFARVESLTCHALLFRELFHIAPVDGISMQSVGYIMHESLQIALAVKQLLANGELVLDVLRDTRYDTENTDGLEITALMIQELAQMNRMYITA